VVFKLRYVLFRAVFVMTSLMYVMLRSVCNVWLLTYRGAFVMSRNVFDWKACNILVLDGLLQPHSSIPYVHIGFILVLYSSSLFSTDS